MEISLGKKNGKKIRFGRNLVCRIDKVGVL